MRSPAFARLVAIALLAEVGFATLNLSAIVLHLTRDRGFGAGWAGLAMTVFLLSEALLKGFAGKAGDQHGLAKWIRVAPWLVAFSALATALIPRGAPGEIFWILALRVLDGAAAAAIWPNLFAYGGRMASEGSRQRAMSSLNACYLLGVAIAFPVGGLADDILGPWLTSRTGYFSGGLYVAVIAFVIVGILAMHLTEPPSEPVEKEAHVDADVRGAVRRIPAYLLLGFLSFVAIGFPLTIVKPFALAEFGLSSSQFGFLVAPAAIGMAALAPALSKRGEYLGSARAVHLGLALCASGAVLVALGHWAPWARTAWMLAVGGIPLGLGFLLALPAWLIRVQEAEPNRRASNLGAVMTAQGVGAIVAAPVGARLYETAGPYTPFIASALALLGAWGISLKLIR